jgi:hypothetical protein
MGDLINTLFSEAMKIQQIFVGGEIAAQDYPASGSFISVRGMHRFAFLIGVGTIDSALTCKIQQADAIDGTPKDITDAVIVIPADGDNKWYMVESEVGHLDMNNGFDHVLLDVAGATGNDNAAVFFLGYGKRVPVEQGADFGARVVVVG